MPTISFLMTRTFDRSFITTRSTHPHIGSTAHDTMSHLEASATEKRATRTWGGINIISFYSHLNSTLHP